MNIYILKYKFETFEKFKTWKDFNRKSKSLELTMGWKFYISDFDQFCKENRIQTHKIVPYTPQQNIVKRMNGTILDEVR